MTNNRNLIACRPGCCGLPLKEAVAVLAGLGLEGVEVNAPPQEGYAELDRMVRAAGMRVTSLSCGAKLDDPRQVTLVESVIAGAGEIGTPILFLSAKVSKGSPEAGIPVLRRLAGKAHAAGVTISIETHPPYGSSGETAKRTIEAVGAKGLGFNFDTANIYFYNPKGVDAVEELKKVLPLVTSVHLKESRGEPKSDDFPVLGQGIVNFPAVFRLLGERGFRGPYTLELEGPLVHGLPTGERTEKVRACLDYLRSIGAMGG